MCLGIHISWYDDTLHVIGDLGGIALSQLMQVILFIFYPIHSQILKYELLLQRFVFVLSKSPINILALPIIVARVGL
jgi:hypothetical protein